MYKNILILGLVAILASALAVECPSQDDDSEAIYYPHETECGKFYECNHGSAVIFECPHGLYWDAVLNVCNRNVDCGDLLTSTVPPPTDEPAPTDEPQPTDGPQPTDAPDPTNAPDPTIAPDPTDEPAEE